MPIRQRYQYQHASGLAVEGIRVGRVNGGPTSNFICYRIGGILIDAGPSNQWRYVKTFIEQQAVKALWLTHHHEDHSGNAARIAKLCGITPFAPELAIEKLANAYPTPIIQKVIWGSPRKVQAQVLAPNMVLEDGSPVVPVHTPGHAKDLTCFYFPEQKWFFSGDLYLAKTLKYMRSDENLAILMTSLQSVLKLDFNVVFCPHRGIDENGYQGLQEKLNFLIQLCKKAQNLHAGGQALEAITLSLLGKKGGLDRLSLGNFSKINLIREALEVDLKQFLPPS
jgi:glyoxylase-like metal-dependent hydrolase (beta-lactamase superfamily II)